MNNESKKKQIIKNNIDEIRSSLPESVTLLAVTKYHDLIETQAVVDAGVKDLGENRVQDLLAKYDGIQGEVNWHFIGHLQTNKVKYIVGKVSLIHSVDSIKLLETIDKESKRINVITDFLLQFNLSKEETKSGFYQEDLSNIIKIIPQFNNIKLRGLMTIGPMTKKYNKIRKIFEQLYKMYDTIKREYLEGDNEINILSMGMTDDYLIAVEEGSTIVRIGRKIFMD